MRHAWVIGSLGMLVLLAGSRVWAGAERPLPQTASFSALERKVAAAVARDVECSSGGETSAAHLQILDRSLSLPLASELHVVSMRPGLSPGSWLLRMQCASPRQCLPFHVTLDSPTARLRDRSANLTDSVTAIVRSRAWAGKPDRHSSPLARSGDHLLLVEERSGMRLKVTVLCLQSGDLGDEIRVQNLDTRRVLRATVAGKNLVKVE